jgi:hypothetical protein
MPRKIAVAKGKAKTNGRQTKAMKEKEATTKAKGRKEPAPRKAITKRKDDDAAVKETEEDVDSEEETLIEIAEMTDETKENARKQAKRKAKERRIMLETENEELKQKMKSMEEAKEKEKKSNTVKIATNLVKLLNTSLTRQNAVDALLYVQQYNHQAKIQQAEPMKVPALFATEGTKPEVIFLMKPHHTDAEQCEEWDAGVLCERLITILSTGKQARTAIQQFEELSVKPIQIGSEAEHTMRATRAIRAVWNQVADGTKAAYTEKEHTALVDALFHNYFGDIENPKKNKSGKDFDQCMRAGGKPKNITEFISKLEAVCLKKHEQVAGARLTLSEDTEEGEEPSRFHGGRGGTRGYQGDRRQETNNDGRGESRKETREIEKCNRCGNKHAKGCIYDPDHGKEPYNTRTDSNSEKGISFSNSTNGKLHNKLGRTGLSISQKLSDDGTRYVPTYHPTTFPGTQPRFGTDMETYKPHQGNYEQHQARGQDANKRRYEERGSGYQGNGYQGNRGNGGYQGSRGNFNGEREFKRFK